MTSPGEPRREQEFAKGATRSWGWLLLGIGALPAALAVVVVWLVVRKRRRDGEFGEP
ncbi:hypothetical protein [Amycolatopsis sp. CA-230715]|uniref:hypothetical protein n=1 Tax=Amycolatopsis sp. CA-230715 TaxID=2745196 RepID=UPI001C00961E|nr:hypothetical protein [Amycolatopsis sp. CA-230715]QWF85172.1 hypothetical protein HUW46_08626 [Amycolatopsis sp. CA-230715]